MQVTIKSADVDARTVKRARDGKAFTFREQKAFVSLGDEVRSVSLNLTEGQAAYPPGKYEVLLEGSVYVDRNGRLALGHLALRPSVLAQGAPAK